MPFQYILANLLARNEDAVGVLFLDEAGETIDLACSDFTPYEMRIVGAYLGIYLRQLGRFLAGVDLGSPRVVHIEKDAIHLHALPLPEGYFLVLVQRHPGLVGRARCSLFEAGEEMKRELQL